MAEDQNREHNEQQRTQRTEQSTAGPEGLLAPENAPSYSASLLGSPRLDGRGTQPVRVALMRQTQHTYGNRAVRQALQRKRVGAASCPTTLPSFASINQPTQPDLSKRGSTNTNTPFLSR